MLIGKNKRKMGKKALVLFFAFLFSIESFAAVVSDNDGSAFITKAEFDSLRNDFQTQIDQYNTSIDSKIDAAIASYLAGINFGATEEVKNLAVAYSPGVTMANKNFLDNALIYKYGRCDLTAIFVTERYWNAGGFYAELGYETPTEKVGNSSYCIVENIYNDDAGTCANWVGYNSGVRFSLNTKQLNIKHMQGPPMQQAYLGGIGWLANGYYEDLNVPFFQCQISASAVNDETAIREPMDFTLSKNTLLIKYNDALWNYKNLCIFDDGNYGGNFHLMNDAHYLMNDSGKTENRVNWKNNLTFKSYQYKDTSFSGTSGKQPTASTYNQNLYGGPAIGFVSSISKWNQLRSSKIKDRSKNIRLVDGIPIVSVSKNKNYIFDIEFDDPSYEYNIYFKVGPFDGEPVENECSIVDLNSGGVIESGKVTKVKNGRGVVKFENINDETGIFYMKWER